MKAQAIGSKLPEAAQWEKTNFYSSSIRDSAPLSMITRILQKEANIFRLQPNLQLGQSKPRYKPS